MNPWAELWVLGVFAIGARLSLVDGGVVVEFVGVVAIAAIIALRAILLAFNVLTHDGLVCEGLSLIVEDGSPFFVEGMVVVTGLLLTLFF